MITRESTPITFIRSLKAQNFIGSIAQNASGGIENIPYPHEIGRSNEIEICSITLITVQNLDWELYFYGSAAGASADPDIDSFQVNFLNLSHTLGEQIGGSGLFYYNDSTIALPYKDLDNSKTLHVSLVNRNATSKIAGAGGYVVLLVGARAIYFS